MASDYEAECRKGEKVTKALDAMLHDLTAEVGIGESDRDFIAFRTAARRIQALCMEHNDAEWQRYDEMAKNGQ